VPAQFAAKLCQLGTQAFNLGFTDAARSTLILPTAVLVFGALACFLMGGKRHQPVGPDGVAAVDAVLPVGH
jgi:hypothetical protein